MPYNPDCPACREKRCHTAEEWRLHTGEGRHGQEQRYIRPAEKSEPSEPKPEADHG